MQKFFTLFTLLLISITSKAQLCPGGGTNFSNAVYFDPTWIYGCTTGTSCSGGTSFDNRAACEPTAAMDACAPAPSCGTYANMGSDLWYKFYATDTTAIINVIQNVSFFASIQAFSGGPACGALTQIGCAIAGGPSQGVALNLTGLTPGFLYYFRVFGTAGPVSQRTGAFCFCGSKGMSAYYVVLPLQLLSLSATGSGGTIKIKWLIANQARFDHFVVERSNDGIHFIPISNRPATNSGAIEQEYTFTDYSPLRGRNFYRLKLVTADGRFTYSKVIKSESTGSNLIRLFPNFLSIGQPFTLETNGLSGKMEISIKNLNGKLLKKEVVNCTYSTTINTEGLNPGSYIVSISNATNSSHFKIIIQ